MTTNYDALIIGAGLNGLTAAAYLAKAGLKTLVLERRAVIGGSTATEEIFPGFKFDTVAHSAGPLPTEIVRDLGLSQRGLEILRGEATSFTPLPDDGHLTLWHDLSRSAESIRRFSKSDADKWAGFAQCMHRLTTFMEAVNGVPIPSVATTDLADLLKVAGLGNPALQLGQAGLLEFARTLPKSIGELLTDWFETDALKGTLGAAGVLGMRQGVRATSTGYVFVHRHAGMRLGAFRSTGVARGGLGSVAYALSAAARQSGAEIRTNAEVTQILLNDDRAVGVALSNGEEIKANVILSGASPRRTFLELLDPLALGADFSWKAQRIRYKGAFAKVNLALAGLPTFTAQPNGAEHLQGVISISPSLDYIERASDAVKYGRWAERPVLEAVIPSLLDPSRAPHGQHTLSIWVQYVPYALEGGWTDEKRKQLGDWVIERLGDYAPNLQSLILHSQVLTPQDLENEYGLPEGDIYHGEMVLDQLFFMRPVPGWAHYNSPVAGLYLCGSGAHPGGALWPGRNAAKQVLLDLKPKR